MYRVPGDSNPPHENEIWFIEPMRAVWLVACLLVLSSCGVSPLLKPPLVAGCLQARIPENACPDLADGVIAYIEGDQEAAEVKIRNAARRATPEQITAFAEALDDLDRLPGSEKFMGPVREVISLLEGRAPARTRESQSNAAEALDDPPSTASTKRRQSSHGTAAAEARGDLQPSESTESPSSLRSATVIVPGNRYARPCAAFSYAEGPQQPGTCLRVSLGPMVITDPEWTGGCSFETFVLAGDPEEPIWFLRTDEGKPFSMHGAALLVPADVPMFVGHRLPASLQLQSFVACAVTWAGRRLPSSETP